MKPNFQPCFSIDTKRIKNGSIRRAFLREFSCQEFSQQADLGMQKITVGEEDWQLFYPKGTTRLSLLYAAKILVSFQEYRTPTGYQRVAIPKKIA